MARVAGLGSFVGVSIGVLLGLRLFHVAVPFFFPETRPGPFAAADFDEAASLAGFAPLVPAYRPAQLGERPSRLIVTRAPRPTIEIEWKDEFTLRITERKGGDAPPAPEPEGPLRHRVEKVGDVWVRVETDLPEQDLERIVRTLGPW